MKTRILYTKIWSDSFFVELSEKEKLIFLYLLTNESVNILHVYECPDRNIMFYTSVTAEELKVAKEKFEQAGKVFFYKGYVYLKNAGKYETYTGGLNDIAKANILKSFSKEVLDWYQRVQDTSLKLVSIPPSKESESLSKGTINHKSEIINNKSEIKNIYGTEQKNKNAVPNETIAGVLQQKYGFQIPKKTGISTAWQDEAFRIAKELDINLKDPECEKEDIKSRWLRLFKSIDADKTSNKRKRLWNIFTYVSDYPPFQSLNSVAKVKYFFKLFATGITKEAGRVELSQKGNLPSPGG